MTDQEFENQLASFQKQLQQAQQAEVQSQKIKEENQRLRQEILSLKETLKTNQERLMSIKEQYSHQEAAKKSIEQHLPEELHSESELDQKIFQLQDEILQFQEKLKAAQESQKELEQNISNQRTKAAKDEREIKTLESELDDRERKLNRELKNKGFQSVDEIRQALLSEEDKLRWVKEIEEWKHRHTELNSYIQQNQEKIGDKPRPDILPLQIALEEKEKHLEAHKDSITRLGSQGQSLEKQASALDKLKKELIQQEQASDAVVQLANLANGNNELNQKFQTYVLSVFLDDVVDYANKRLRILSQDRYQLQRTEEVQHGNRKAGLDLKVFDSYSGKERLVHNLSGGETFFTSLALALGLADVATANAGGIRLDAMFIDEGFGTLDSETLDL
ncbi:MAG: SbcC/MukB-like Walker B domain-containing protein, partial [Bacteroidota bacterium]